MILKKNKVLIIVIVITLILGITLVIMQDSAKNKEESLESESIEPAYIENLFNKDEVMQINIEITEENWNNLCENAIEEEYYIANITINDTVYKNVGIRAKGNSTLTQIAQDDTTDRYSFKVKFDKYVEGQTLQGLEKLALNNMMSDTTYMKEYLSYDLLEKMGIQTPAYQYANITLNGEPWGLYLAIEVMEESYIERYFGSSIGNLYKPETTDIVGGGINGMKPNMGEEITMPEGMEPPTGEQASPPEGQELPPDFNEGDMVPPNMMEKPDFKNEEGGFGNKNNFAGGANTGGADLVYKGEDLSNYTTILEGAVFNKTTETDLKKVVEMIKALSEDIDNIESYLDVDQVLRYFAVNTFLVNLDSYVSSLNHNYYLYEQDGICSILPWDYNLSFGAFQGGSAEQVINFPIDNPVSDSLEASPLIGKLLQVESYKETYHGYLKEIVEEYINNGVYEEKINNLNALIKDYVKNDATAFYSFEEYEAALSQLKIFGVDRAKSIEAQLEGTQPSTTTGNMATTLDLQSMGSQGGNKFDNKDMKKREN